MIKLKIENYLQILLILCILILTSALIIEYIFGWNGLGKLLVDALISVDFPLVMGVILVIATCFIVINILVDLIYVWLDPRVKIN